MNLVWIVLAVVGAIAAIVGAFIVVPRVWRALPPPTSFAEGQRALYGALAALAGIFCAVLAVAMIALLMWGGWSKDQEHTIVVIFGCTLGGFVCAMAAVIIGLLAGGPVGRFKANATIAGNSVGFDAGGDDDQGAN